MKTTSLIIASIFFIFCYTSNLDAQQINWGYKFHKGQKLFYSQRYEDIDLYNKCVDKDSVNLQFLKLVVIDEMKNGNYILQFTESRKRNILDQSYIENIESDSVHCGVNNLQIILTPCGELVSADTLSQKNQVSNSKKKTQNKNLSMRPVTSSDFSIIKSNLSNFILPLPKTENITLPNQWSDTTYTWQKEIDYSDTTVVHYDPTFMIETWTIDTTLYNQTPCMKYRKQYSSKYIYRENRGTDSEDTRVIMRLSDHVMIYRQANMEMSSRHCDVGLHSSWTIHTSLFREE